MEYEIQFARLITSEKLPDRFLNAQLKANSDLSKSSMGEVFSLVEILTPWFPTAQIGQTIIQTFSDSYYNGGSTSDLVNFENSLKKVNTSLALITQNGETDWLGNLNSILGVIVENKIHLAQAGKSEAYMFRDGKINHLTEGLASSNSESHPLNTFSNITSGELKNQDKILIASPDLYKNLSIENLRQIIGLSTPKEAVMQIGKLLKKKKVSTVNMLIINLLSIEELAKMPVDSGSETIYLDKPLESFFSGLSRLWHGLMFPIIKSIGKKSKEASNNSIGFTKNYLKTLHQKRQSSEMPKKQDLYEKEFIGNNLEDNLLKDEEINYSPELDVHYYNEEQKQKNNKIAPIINNFTSFVSSIYKKIKNTISGLIKNKRTRPYFFIFCAIVLLVIVFAIIKMQHKDDSNYNLNEAQEVLRQAEYDQSQADQAVLSGDTEKAKILFSSAIDKAYKIKDFPVVNGSANDVINNSFTKLDKLTSTARYNNLSPILSLDNDAENIFVVSGKVYATSGGTVYRGLISGGKAEKIGSVSSATIICGTIIGNNIYFYTSNQKIYELNTSTEKINLSSGTVAFETANGIASYASAIYLLDGIIGQIYRHNSNDSGFGAGESYITSKSIDLKNAKSITIDGSIYVLKNNGEVIKLQKSKLQDFSVKNIPSPNTKIENPLKIYTNDDAPSIYVLDGGKSDSLSGQKRIIEIDKNGEFFRQYVIQINEKLTDFFVNVKAKKIYILSENKVFEIGI